MTRDEIERRVARLRDQLEHANGEYAEQLEQDIAHYERSLAPCDCRGIWLVCSRHRERGD